MSGSIFISYRRQDAKYPAWMLYKELRRILPADRLFMDIASIPPGAEFASAIVSWIKQCDVLLAVMGESWSGPRDQKTGLRRLDDPEDLVRVEIRTALENGKTVVPVLLDGASMPKAEDLPRDLHGLLHLNARRLRFDAFDDYAPRLVADLGRLLTSDRAAAPPLETAMGEAGGFLYLHRYLSRPEHGQARQHVRTQLPGKLFADWSPTDSASASVVAASYDQAQILIRSGAITGPQREFFLSSSWGESICHQYETLDRFLAHRQTPTATGKAFFRHFAELYEDAARINPLFVVMSGGQSGADRAALDAAIALSIPYQGWVPAGGWAEDMQQAPGLLAHYPRLTVCSTADLEVRTKLNIENSDTTLVLTDGGDALNSPGTELTLAHAAKSGKPATLIRVDEPDARENALAWLAAGHRPRLRLNVAGPRESEHAGLQQRARTFLLDVLSQVVAERKAAGFLHRD